MSDIGEYIRTLREKKQWTQEELADKLHVTRQTISNYEKGRSKPDVEMIKKIASVLEVDAQYLLYGESHLQSKSISPRTWSGAFIILTSIIILDMLHSFSTWYSSRYFVAYPYLILNFFLDPAVAFFSGWWSTRFTTTLLGRNLIKGKWNRWIIPLINISMIQYCIFAISGLGNRNSVLHSIPGYPIFLDYLYRFCSEKHILFCITFTLVGFARGIVEKRKVISQKDPT